MKVSGLLIVSLIFAALMVVFAFHTATLLPPGTELPTHWGFDGKVDDTQPALRALLMPPVILVLLSGFFALVPRLEPLQDRLQASAPLLRVTWLGMIMLMAFIQAKVAAPAYGLELGSRPIVLAVGLFMLLVGNVLPKSRPGFFIGIRTPWTIVDTDIWVATHRLGGKLMMLAGAAIVILALVPLVDPLRFAIFVALAIGAALVPVVYSWWLWHRKKQQSGA